LDEQVRASHNSSIEDNFVFLFSAVGGRTTAHRRARPGVWADLPMAENRPSEFTREFKHY